MDKPALEVVIEFGKSHLPGHLGVEIVDNSPGFIAAELEVAEHLLAPNGYLHAATVVALADTAAGYGAVDNLPEGAIGFTTIELKTNFIGSAHSGRVRADTRLVHGGRTTQLWEANVIRVDDGKLIARFTCTQLMMYPEASPGS